MFTFVDMQRKEFLSRSVLAGGSLLAGKHLPAAASPKNGEPFHLNYGIHDGMFKNLAGPVFTDQIKFAYDQGFRAIEDNGMMDRPAEEQARIGDTLKQLGMTMGVFVLNFDHWPVSTSLCSGDPAWQKKFLDACRDAIDVAARCNGRWITVVPGNYDRKLAMGYQTTHVIHALRKACEILEPHGLVMVLEALSDTPPPDWLIRVQHDVLDRKACCRVKCRCSTLRSNSRSCQSRRFSGLSGDEALQSRFALMTVVS